MPSVHRHALAVASIQTALLILTAGAMIACSIPWPRRRLTAAVRRASTDVVAEHVLPAGGDDVGTLPTAFRSLALPKGQAPAAEMAVARLHRWNELLLACAGEGIFGLDRMGRTTFINPAAERMLGYEQGELLDQPQHEQVHHTRPDGTPYPRQTCHIYAALSDGTVHQIANEVFWRKDGSSFPVEYTSTPIWEDGEIIGAVVTFRDITERQRAEATLRHQATHDALTALPNRLLLQERLNQVLGMAAESGSTVALLLLDLDRFKEVNDTLGHGVGDQLLQQLAVRLRAAAPDEALVARMGGDEFALLLRGDSAEAIEIARLIKRSFAVPFSIAGHGVEVEASIGIAPSTDPAIDADTLLRHADVAMYAAKRAMAGYAVYTPEHDTYNPNRLALLGDLRRGIEEEQLFLVFQPKLSVAEQEVVGVEALVRWQHPRRGLISPDQFIPLAEATGAITPLTLWVLDAAIKQCGRWRQAGLTLPIAVNLSARTLHDALLLTIVSDLLVDYQVPPGWLTLEITESAIMEDLAGALVMLTRLGDMGIHLEIDDFGTGYSSLAYLKRLPVAGLKVDRAFVQHLEEDANDAAIVAATIGLAHDLGLHVVAEGVETAEALQRLAGLGCDVAQGYYFSRPLPAADLECWLRARSAAPQMSVGHE